MPKRRPQPAAILTISDSVSKKKRQDLSGPALKEVL
jgi:molybdopterin adenylyltransferase